MRIAKVIICTAVAAVAVLPLAKSRAQANQVVVLDCSRGGATMTITLDLAAKTFIEESSSPNPGGSPDPIVNGAQGKLTGITDQVVTWAAVPRIQGNAGSYTASLNRYTGVVFYSGPGRSGAISCRRQEKKF